MKTNFRRCRGIWRLGILAEILVLLLHASPLPAAAQAPPREPDGADTVRVGLYVNGVPYPGRAVLYQDTTYVELHEFASEVRLCRAEWREKERCAVFTSEGLTLSVPDGAAYICANGRYLWCAPGVFSDKNASYVPLRAAVKAFGGTVEWNADEFAAYVRTTGVPIASGDKFYKEEEVLWLSRIIYAEAGIEPFLGQIAVGNVVLNRVRSPYFPNTVYEVIFDHSFGVAQFSPTENGTVYCVPSAEAVIAAKICLEGYTVSDKILYFINAALARSLWVPQNCEYVMTIQSHDFYS